MDSLITSRKSMGPGTCEGPMVLIGFGVRTSGIGGFPGPFTVHKDPNAMIPCGIYSWIGGPTL